MGSLKTGDARVRRPHASVHGLAVLTGQGPLRDVPDVTRQHLEKLTSAFIEAALV